MSSSPHVLLICAHSPTHPHPQTLAEQGLVDLYRQLVVPLLEQEGYAADVERCEAAFNLLSQGEWQRVHPSLPGQARCKLC